MHVVLGLLSLLLIISFIAFLPRVFADIMSDVTLFVTMFPVDIQSKCNRFIGSIKDGING